MSSVVSPSAPPSSPSYPIQRQSTAPVAPKLRDSCHACALSKVKCHKEKPKCSRCVKRGLKCEYVATKRGGRKHGARLNNGDSGGNTTPVTDSNGPPLLPLGNWFGPNSTVPTIDDLQMPGSVNIHPGPSPAPSTSGSSSNLFSNLLSTTDQSLSSVLSDLNTDLDNFFASPVSLSVQDTSDTDITNHTNFFSNNGDGSISNDSVHLLNNFPSFDEFEGSDLIAFPDPQCPPNSRDSHTFSDDQTLENHLVIPTAGEEDCGCLVLALSLMKQLFPNQSSACTSASSNFRDSEQHTSLPTIEAVIAKNEQTAEAVSGMLNCTCSQDGYLLAVMSLIVFKVLGWYAAAARSMWRKTTPISGEDEIDTTHAVHDDHDGRRGSVTLQNLRNPSSSLLSHHSEQVRQVPVVVGNYALDGEDSGRMAAQLVLSELHRVQRLVNQLSSKLKAHVQMAKMNSDCGGATFGDVGYGMNGSGLSTGENESLSPFSAVMLEQMAVDMRKRLRALSLEIVERLRTE